jgi:hypothetical protein
MQAQVNVAPARWWHVPGLSRLIRETRRRPDGAPAAGDAALLWSPYWSPSLGLLQSVWTSRMPGLPGPRSFVAETSTRPVGLAQMRPRDEPNQWEVVYLALEDPVEPARLGLPDGTPAPLMFIPDRRATRLLGELCDAGVQLGAERIFASIADDGVRYELFKQVGFSVVVREYDYVRTAGGAPPLPGEAPAIAGMRRQQRADSFGLLQLYQACTPKLVQMAEGKRSRSWDLPVPGWGRRLTYRRGEGRWVVERDGRKVAWLRLSRRSQGAPGTLSGQLLVDPHAADLTRPLVEFALARAARAPVRSILIRVREQQSAVMSALESWGFDPVESRLLMVKQLAAPVRHPQLVPALEKVV